MSVHLNVSPYNQDREKACLETSYFSRGRLAIFRQTITMKCVIVIRTEPYYQIWQLAALSSQEIRC